MPPDRREEAAPEGGDWPEWRRLVLDSQRRFGYELREMAQEVRSLAKHADVVELEKRMALAEQKLEAAEDRIDTYRKTIVAVSLALFASIGLPIVRAWLTSKGAGG